jgi:hypothetical protein
MTQVLRSIFHLFYRQFIYLICTGALIGVVISVSKYLNVCRCNLCRQNDSNTAASENRPEVWTGHQHANAPVRLVPRLKRLAADTVSGGIRNPIATAS